MSPTESLRRPPPQRGLRRVLLAVGEDHGQWCLEQTALVDGGTQPASSRRAVRKPAERPYAYRPDPEVVVYTTAWCGWCRVMRA